MTFARWMIAGVLVFGTCLFGQDHNNNDVRLFQTFFRDAAFAKRIYVQPLFEYAGFDGGNGVRLGVDGGIPVSSQFEIVSGLHFINLNPEVGKSRSGISDLPIFGKYYLDLDAGRTQVVAGGFITLPIGNDDVGQGNFDFGGFGSLRHPLAEGTVLTGTLGLNFQEFGDDRETSLLVAGGLIYQAGPDFAVLGELNLETQNDVGLLTIGVDYQSGFSRHFRGMVGFGVDDGSPDFIFQVSLLNFLSR